jgi:cobalt-zinc-cadmium efflux system membrane fusion protein
MTRNRLAGALAAVVIFSAGAFTTYLFRDRHAERNATLPSTMPPHAAGGPSAAGASELRLAPDLIARAGIRVETVSTGAANAGLTVPGTVQPNAYRRVSVTPLAAGRVTRVPIELGQRVSRGAIIAEIYSPDLAEARTQYLSMKAELEAGEARVSRTERLAQIGAASQQELEQVRAEHTRHQTEVEHAASRLRLLGVDPSRVTHENGVGEAAATVRVLAPQAGVVLERPATVGMTVEPATVLATLADLSSVWIIADVYERDFRSVRTGMRATVSADAYPGRIFIGTVTYVAPDVRQATRTAEVRAEVPNGDGALRLGMFVTVTLELPRPQSDAVVVPRAAVQTVGSQTVIYTAIDEAAGRFAERPVVLGDGDQQHVAVTSGLSAGDRLVTSGSFSLRAEAERLGLHAGGAPAAPAAASVAPAPQNMEVRVTANGFEPATLMLQAGRPTRVTFIRTTDETCAKEVVLPDYAIRRTLPLNQRVTLEFVPRKNATAGFTCGMNMLRGTLVVK